MAKKPFALPGDSGALVLDRHGVAVGLLHAIHPDGRTYACKASWIEALLNVSFKIPISADAAASAFDPAVFPTDPKVRFDVLIGGISIGHGSITAGTLGTFVWDNDNHELLGLTCAHVAAPFGAKIGDPIYQPGPLDIRAQFRREPNESDVAGHLIRWMPLSSTKRNKIDAALFRPTRPVWLRYILAIGERSYTGPTA